MEIWKSVKGYEGLYEVSNLGRIKRLPKIVTNNFGTFKSKEIILKGNINQRGYIKQTLTIDGKANTHLIHRLVAQAFLPNLDNREMVNHINGLKYDNRLENLEWVTSSENVQHALRTKLLVPRKGSDIYFSKFNEKEVSIILYKCRIEGKSSREIAKELGINDRTISDIVKNKTWKHVMCPQELSEDDINHYENFKLIGNIQNSIIAKLKTKKFEINTLNQIKNLLEETNT